MCPPCLAHIPVVEPVPASDQVGRRLSMGYALWRAREPSSRRQRDPQAARLPGARRDHGVAAVQPRDLPHQRETEARALALAAHAMERREYLVALGLRDAGAAVCHLDDGSLVAP